MTYPRESTGSTIYLTGFGGLLKLAKQVNYYNENDPKAAAWLRELITAGDIAPGHVDERSIRDVRGGDLAGFVQCHFFAGIGGWSYALRLAGWPDDEAVWTGSCPCQPFSSAGKAQGLCDERHLWPAFRGLIAERHPAIVFGEQVAGADGRSWLAGVRSDLEGDGYAVGAADLCAAGVGAPHIRQRLYWVANAHRSLGDGRTRSGQQPIHNKDAESCRLADMQQPGFQVSQANGEYSNKIAAAFAHGNAGRLAESSGVRLNQHGEPQNHSANGDSRGQYADGCRDLVGLGHTEGHEQRRQWESGQINGRPGSFRGSGPWSNFQLIPCRDGKSRRIESGTFPLAYGIPGRVGLLRGYGNAIVAPLAAQFIKASREAMT